MFYKKKSVDVHWDGTYASLQALRLGVINGWVYGEQFEAQRAGLNITSSNSVISGLKMLQSNRFDLLACNVRCGDILVENLSLASDITTLDPDIGIKSNYAMYGYFAFCKIKNCDNLRLQFDQFFQGIKDSGELENIAKVNGVALP